jgi:hypothetical protein
MKWYPFDPLKGSRQKRPPVYRHVLVELPPKDKFSGASVAVGYRKNAAGDKQSPYFVIPGIGGVPIRWCDCLGDDYLPPPSWAGELPNKKEKKGERV